MQDYDENFLMRRFADLSGQAMDGGYYTVSDFLSPAEQALLVRMAQGGEVHVAAFSGGYPQAERKMAVFGSEEEFGYPPTLPGVWLSIVPAAKKFAEELSHRDFLGSLMGLGIKREVLGDILISDNEGYLFLQEEMVDYVAENLVKVRHTDVICTPAAEPPAERVALPEPEEIVAGGERADALVAAVYRLSRSESSRLFERGLVALDGRPVDKPSLTPAPGTMISVRGFGRFLYEGLLRDTRKGRIWVSVRIFR